MAEENQPSESTDLSSQESIKLTKTQLIEIKKYLKCTMCSDIFLDPVTLFCQHTFCSLCLENKVKKSMVTCHECQYQSFVSPTSNFKIKELIEHLYTKTELDLRLKRSETFDISKECKESKLKREIRKNVWRNVINQEPTSGGFSNYFPQLQL